MHTRMIIQSSGKNMDAALTFWMHIWPKTFRAITRLPVELQSSRSVPLDQRDEIYVHARRELHPPKAGCGMDVRSLVLYFLRCSIQAPSKGSDKAWMEVQKHGCASSHPRCFSGLCLFLVQTGPWVMWEPFADVSGGRSTTKD